MSIDKLPTAVNETIKNFDKSIIDLNNDCHFKFIEPVNDVHAKLLCYKFGPGIGLPVKKMKEFSYVDFHLGDRCKFTLTTVTEDPEVFSNYNDAINTLLDIINKNEKILTWKYGFELLRFLQEKYIKDANISSLNDK